MNRRRAEGLPPNIFARIVAAVPMEEAAERYGLAPDRRGWCCCPFHNEKTPSFKIYPGTGGFYCFGCGLGGDVLTFAELMFHLSPVEAARRLDADFGLGVLDISAPDPGEITAWQQHRAAQAASEAARNALKTAISVRLKKIHDLPVPRAGDDDYAALYALEQANEEYLNYMKESL